jgi:transposase
MGYRVDGYVHWLHTVAKETLTHYRVSAKRGEMPEGLTGGVAVHDGFKSYRGCTDVGHAVCNAHHPRELKCL